LTAAKFTGEFRESLASLLALRRDVRRFRSEPLPSGLLDEMLRLAALAPSVGFSQPWRWVSVDSPERRAAIVANFRACNQQALADYSGDRAALYSRLKLSGLVEAPVHLAVFVDPGTTVGHGLGRKTMPETLSYSAVCAVHTLWLVARAHGVGVGWVSILDEADVRTVLDVPPGWQLIAYLCLGYPEQERDRPELEQEGWETRRPEASACLRR
jgi:5,6-dimethylbenzimidazole synthase